MSDELHERLAGYIDGELDEEQRREFEQELARNPGLRAELEKFRKLKEVTDVVRYADLPLEVWENYWHNLYRKLERGVGWIFFSIGAIVLLCFGAYEMLSALYTDPAAPLWLKIGISGVVLGAIILLVSYGRERLFAYNRERYREVQR